METLLLALAPALVGLVASLVASSINEKVRQNKEAGVQSGEALVWAGIIFNVVAANKDKVGQLLREGGAPDGRKARAP